jgi:hypothetical protein
MSDDNVVSFPGKDGKEEKETKATRQPDDLLELAKGRYDEVVIIGMNSSGSQCISSIGAEEAIFHLHRAVYKLHAFLDKTHKG